MSKTNNGEGIIDSPCVRNCCLNEDDICLGCFRSLTDILAWGNATNLQKISILESADVRKKSYREKYNSRKY